MPGLDAIDAAVAVEVVGDRGLHCVADMGAGIEHEIAARQGPVQDHHGEDVLTGHEKGRGVGDRVGGLHVFLRRGRQGIEPRPEVLETFVLPEHLRGIIQQDSFYGLD